ncbi:trace amine-associated receptor 5-like [Oculina patagonica]
METWFWILGWFLSILTMTGNGFVISIVCRKRQLRTKTNAFVVSLAVADFFVGMTAVPSLFFCEMASSCNTRGLHADGIDFIRWLFMYPSAANLCSLVLDRYIAVVKPLRYLTFMKRRRVIQMISLSWAIPVAFIVLESSLWLSLKIPLINHIIGWLCMLLELLLCVILIFFFASMLHVIYKHALSVRTLAKQLRFNHIVFVKAQETSAVKMMAVVIGLFLLCYGLLLRCSFVMILSDYKPCNDLQYKVPILLLNSAVNPIAYAVFKRDIKMEFKRLINFVK